VGYSYGNLTPTLISTATNPSTDEMKRIDAAKKLIRRFLQSSASSDEVTRLVDLLAAGMKRLSGSSKPPNPVDLVFTDYVIVHLSELFTFIGERLETVSFKGSTPRERREADELIRDHFFNDKEKEVCESIREDDLDDLIDLIENDSLSESSFFMLPRTIEVCRASIRFLCLVDFRSLPSPLPTSPLPELARGR